MRSAAAKGVLPAAMAMSVTALLASGSASLARAQTTPTPNDSHADHAHPMTQAQLAPHDASLPPDEAGAKEAVAKTPRHAEYVDVKVAGRATPVKTFVVYPERKDKAPVVIVIHEIFGLSEWIKGVADQLAKEGFIAVAPDLLSGKGTNGGGTETFGADAVRAAVSGLTRAEVVASLDAVRAHAIKLPAANGKSASIGFCWGGTTSFAYATAQPGLDAVVVYYGTSPSAEALAAIKAPVLGLYGGDDARVDATIEPASTEMKKLGKIYEPHIYDGAGHAFLRQQNGKDGANLKASQQAWPATVAFLRDHTT
jgi:carboxymethylenebutenolidase